MAIDTGMVRVGELDAYLAEPEGGAQGAMVLLPMITGIAERVRTFAADIATAGVTTLCWDPFHGANIDTHTVEQLHERLAGLDDETAVNEQRRLVEYLHTERGVHNVGTIGYCLGGRFAFLLAASEPRVASVVAYHPTVPVQMAEQHTMDPFAAVERIGAPVLMHYPGQDAIVPAESFRKLQQGLQSRADAETVVHLYPRAGHGFSDPGRSSGEANESAYARSWPQTLEFIRHTVG